MYMKYFKDLINRIFTKSNINKAIIIFIIGFVSRIIVNYTYGINVYIEYLHNISIIYYVFMSLFIVLLHEVVIYFDINIIPSFIYNYLEFIINALNKLVKNLYRLYLSLEKVSIKNLSLEDLRFSSIKNIFRLLFRDKLFNNAYIDINNKSNNEELKLPKLPFILNRGKGSNTEELLTNRVYRPNISSYSHQANSIQNNSTQASNIQSNDSQSNSSQENNFQENNFQDSQVNNNSMRSLNTDFAYNVDNRTNQSLFFIIDSIRNPNGESPFYTSYNTDNRNGISHDNMPNTPIPDNLSTPSISTINTPRFPPLEQFDSYNIERSSLFPEPLNMNNTSVTSTKLASTEPLSNKQMLESPSINEHPVFKNQITSKSVVIPNKNKYTYVPTVQENLPTIISREIAVEKSGIMGKFKLGFNLWQSKLSSGNDKIKSVYIKYETISKRKLVWYLWEEGSGEFESYKDFKRNWNPNTKLWTEIKKRTHIDIQSDIKNLLRSSNPFKSIEHKHNMSKGIDNLYKEGIKRPSTNMNKTVNSSNYGNNSNKSNDNSYENKNKVRKDDHNNNHTNGYKDSHRHNHSHSHNHSDNHSHSHNHGHGHRHSNGRSHSHSHSHGHGHGHGHSHSHSHKHNYSHRNKIYIDRDKDNINKKI